MIGNTCQSQIKKDHARVSIIYLGKHSSRPLECAPPGAKKRRDGTLFLPLKGEARDGPASAKPVRVTRYESESLTLPLKNREEVHA